MTTTRRAPPPSTSGTPTPAVDRPLPAAKARDASTAWQLHGTPIYQATLYIIYHAGLAGMTSPTTHHAAWQLHGTPIYQTTLYIIYHAGPAGMTTPTTHQADWQLHGTPIYIRPLHIIYHVGPAAMKAPTPELQPAADAAPMPMLATRRIDGSRRCRRQRRPCQGMRRVEGS